MPLYRVLCKTCGWKSTTRKGQIGPKHACPECRSPDLKLERLSG